MTDRERRLRLTIYDSTRRPLRRGWWSHWKLEIHHENLAEKWPTWIEPLTEGWIRRGRHGQFVELDLGAETEVSRQILAQRYGELA